ncbi:unnamed protein product, partial [Citrullus colocynthis]
MELLQRSTIWRRTQKENHEEARMARSRFMMQGDVIADSPAGLWSGSQRRAQDNEGGRLSTNISNGGGGKVCNDNDEAINQMILSIDEISIMDRDVKRKERKCHD